MSDVQKNAEEFATRWTQRYTESKSDSIQFYEHNKSLLFHDFYNNVWEPYINSDEFKQLCEETNKKLIDSLADYRDIAKDDRNNFEE